MKKLFISGMLAVSSLVLFNACNQATTTKSATNSEALAELPSVKKDMVNRGYEIYKAKCSMCHMERITKEQEMKFRKLVMAGERPPINAPPMNEVSARVKHFYPTEDKFVAFVTDYITNPSREKGLCMPMAFKMFGVMPPIGANLSEEDKKAVALWLYYNYTDKWEDFNKGMGKGMGGKGEGHNCPIKKLQR